LGLVAAIQERAGQDRLDHCHVTVDGPGSLDALPAAVEVAAFRIVQEALTNVERHAQANACYVRLWRCDAPRESLCIEIVDDGVGISSDTSQRAGVGLLSMQERAAELGGTCTVAPDPRGGTRLSAHLPLVPE
ncbi:MAG TPA: ATP-binding protein, partial [Chloroflexota bacterium]|nr:ATP-binding protein [Chloroflexota bacterium]